MRQIIGINRRFAKHQDSRVSDVAAQTDWGGPVDRHLHLVMDNLFMDSCTTF